MCMRVRVCIDLDVSVAVEVFLTLDDVLTRSVHQVHDVYFTNDALLTALLTHDLCLVLHSYRTMG